MRLVRIANYFGPALEHIIVGINGDYSAMKLIEQPVDAGSRPICRLANGFFARLAQSEEVIEEIHPDRLITHNWGTIEWAVAARRKRIPHIHIEDGFGTDEAQHQKLRRVVARRIVLGASEVVAPSNNLVRIARKIWGIPAERLHYIPNGIDCGRYCRPWRWSDEPVIGIVAALRPEKNVSRLLRAFALVNRTLPCRLTVVGDGPERSKLDDAARALGIGSRVSFTGHVDDPIPLYHSFNLFALSSDTEQMPYTVLEAMAAGLPVVATDVGDVKSMVSDQNAPLIAGRSETALAKAILEVAGDAPFARRIGDANSRKVGEHYRDKRMFKAFARLYGLEA